MTRSDVMASSRPHTPSAAPTRSRPRGVRRALCVVAALALALALVPSVALAASETTTGYKQEPKEPKTTTTTTTTPKAEEKPSTTSTTTTTPEKVTTLPYTGLDLRWEIGLAVLLVLAGGSILFVQRRQRRAGSKG